MASLQCSKCNEGIHYHSFPQGIEYIYFSRETWNQICNTSFDKAKKIMDDSGLYPKLYRSSTIEIDFPNQFYKIWRCPSCSTFHIFSDDGTVNRIFVKDNQVNVEHNSTEGIMFADYLWDEITEKDISNTYLASITPSFYVRTNSKHMLISNSSNFDNPESYKLFIPEWMST